MAVRLVDLSVPLENYAAEYHSAKIEYIDHYDFANKVSRTWGLDPADFPEPYVGGSIDEVSLTSHAGTHVDAPIHFGPLTEGKPGKTIDQVPLEWCYGDGVVLDFTSKGDGEYITIADIEAALERIGHTLSAGEIVLFHTGAGKHWGRPDYVKRGSGLDADGVFWLVERGIRMMGTDAYSLDIPVHLMAEALKNGEKDRFFPVHRAGREVEYVHAEKVVNLDQLPATGFKVSLFPVNIRRGTGAWCRAVAIIEE